MKIKWVNITNSSEGLNPRRWKSFNFLVSLNPGYYILRSYLKYKSKNYDLLDWCSPIFFPIKKKDDLINDILKENVDILCLSCFTWNIHFNKFIANELKKIKPEMIIICGGPEPDAHRVGPEIFFKENPYFDYVVYGDGEEPFAALIDSIIEKKPLPEECYNLVTKEKVYPHRVFSDTKFWNMSPILELKDIIKSDIEYFKSIGRTDIQFYWEIDRGCPYACAFCDWSSGLHHKVKRRSKFWKEELDFIKQLGVELKFTGANFGLYKEDVEIAQYIADIGIKFQNGFIAKLNKDRVFQIHRIWSKNNPSYLVPISVQDLNEDVLNNINRPEIPWEEHKKYILDFNRDFPNQGTYGELVIGLPGQTYASIKKQLLEFFELDIKIVSSSLWVLLTNSPAYSKEYQKKYQLIFKDTWVPSLYHDDPAQNERNITKERLAELYASNSSAVHSSKIIWSTYSANTLEIIKMQLIAQLYTGIRNYNKGNISEIYNNPKFDIIINDYAMEALSYIEKNGMMGFWNPEKEMYEGIEIFAANLYFINYVLERLDNE